MCECLQVLLFGESQGGHVAAKMAARIRPDLLIFISSLSELVDAEAIRRDDITTVVGVEGSTVICARVLYKKSRLCAAGGGEVLRETRCRFKGGREHGPESLFGA